MKNPPTSARIEANRADMDPFSVLRGIDVPALIERLGGRVTRVGTTLRSFANSFVTVGEQLRACLDSEQRDEAARLIHTIKGVSGTIGANEVYECSSELEKAIADGETDEAFAKLDVFEQALDVVLRSCAAFEQKPSAPADGVDYSWPQPEVAELSELLLELGELLDRSNLRAMSCFEQLRAHPRSNALSLDDLDAAIDQLSPHGRRTGR